MPLVMQVIPMPQRKATLLVKNNRVDLSFLVWGVIAVNGLELMQTDVIDVSELSQDEKQLVY